MKELEVGESLSALRDYCSLSGLQDFVVLQLIELCIKHQYFLRGRTVVVSASVENDTIITMGLEYNPYNEEPWSPITDLIRPDLSIFTTIVDNYLAGEDRWSVGWAQVLSVQDSFYVLILPNDQTVSLPFSHKGGNYQRLGPGVLKYHPPEEFDPKPGDTLFLAYRPIIKKEFRDGVAPWLSIGADYLGTRVDSIFLRLTAYNVLAPLLESRPELQTSLRSEIYGGAGILVLPVSERGDGIPGPGGENMTKMRILTGLRRTSFVFAPPTEYTIQHRIRFALQQVSGVRGKVSDSPNTDYGIETWTVSVPHKDFPKAMGENACNCVFVQRLTNSSIYLTSSR